MVRVKCFDPETGDIHANPLYEAYVSDEQIERIVSEMNEAYPDASIEVIYNEGK